MEVTNAGGNLVRENRKLETMEQLLKRSSEFSISGNTLYYKLCQADFLKEMTAKSISYEALRSPQVKIERVSRGLLDDLLHFPVNELVRLYIKESIDCSGVISDIQYAVI